MTRALIVAAVLLLAGCGHPHRQDWSNTSLLNRGYGYGYPNTGYQGQYQRRPYTPTTRPYWGTWGY